jgi:hypothetical protein
VAVLADSRGGAHAFSPLRMRLKLALKVARRAGLRGAKEAPAMSVVGTYCSALSVAVGVTDALWKRKQPCASHYVRKNLPLMQATVKAAEAEAKRGARDLGELVRACEIGARCAA